jgi:hypothetical protein
MDVLNIWALSFDSIISLDLCSRILLLKLSHLIHKEELDIAKGSHCVPPGNLNLNKNIPLPKMPFLIP